MRRHKHHQHKISRYVSPESALPKDHPLRPSNIMEERASSKRCLSDNEHPSDSNQHGAVKNPEPSFSDEKRNAAAHAPTAESDSPLYGDGKGNERISRYTGFVSIDSVLWWMTK